jgi:hypothetical protein
MRRWQRGKKDRGQPPLPGRRIGNEANEVWKDKSAADARKSELIA